MSAAFLVWYLAYVLLASYARDFMAVKLFGNINVGLVIGLLQFVTTFAITTIYVRYANKHLDPAAERPTGCLTLKVKKAAAKPAKQVAKTPLKKNFRRVAKAITSQTAGQYYRADLKDAALQRWSSVYRFAMVKKGLKKPAKGKYGRKSDSA